MNKNLEAYKTSQNLKNLDKNPHEIVQFLMEHIISCLENIITDLTSDKIENEYIDLKEKAEKRSKNLSKSLTIIYSLQISLDFDKSPDISNNLFQMYEFCRQQIIKFIKSQSTSGLHKSVDLIREILEAWNSIPISSKKNV